MKKYIYFLLIALTGAFVACQEDGSDFLDKEETNDIYEDQVFTTPQYAVWYLNGIYRELNDADYVKFGSAGFLGNAVDEGQPKANWDNAHVMGSGAWGPTVNPLNEDVWAKNYSAIRAANKFIINVDSIPDSDEPKIDASIRERMKGEATFLRAMFYYQLLQHYGGVPLITVVLDQYSPELQSPRNTYDEVVEFICTEADKAANLLPDPEGYDAAEFGRVTKGAALALISRVRLLAASPLFNDSEKPEDSPFRGAYSENKWKVAAEAAKRLIEYAQDGQRYALHTSTTPSTLGDYEDFFIRRSSPEIILSYQSNVSKSGNVNLERVCLPGPFFNYGHGVINNLPVLNLVADYEAVTVDATGNVTGSYELGMEKVKQLYESGQVDPVSGFDPQNPYVNRDPRFYQSIWYNEVAWPARKGIIFDVWQRHPENGGELTSDGTHFLTGWYNTGFFHRKFLDPYGNIKGWGTNLNVTHNYPIFRYAEFLLNYAEAVNEAFGNPDVAPAGYPMSAREAVNMIRRRATFPSYSNNANVPKGMPLNAKGKSLPDIASGLDQDEMRHKIRHERRIELAFEEHRFWDVRRWKIGDQTQHIYAQRVYKNNDGSIEYDIELIVIREWRDKFSLFPIKETEIMKNPNLVQNPGWTIEAGM